MTCRPLGNFGSTRRIVHTGGIERKDSAQASRSSAGKATAPSMSDSANMPAPCSLDRRTLIKHLGVSGSLLAAVCASPALLFAANSFARTFGIDVSKWGGEIDWHEVREKLDPRFVFVQAYHWGRSEASSYANPRFANYRRDLQRLGILHGAYLRCHPNTKAETSIKRFGRPTCLAPATSCRHSTSKTITTTGAPSPCQCESTRSRRWFGWSRTESAARSR